jgi:hypothetical protein
MDYIGLITLLRYIANRSPNLVILIYGTICDFLFPLLSLSFCLLFCLLVWQDSTNQFL